MLGFYSLPARTFETQEVENLAARSYKCYRKSQEGARSTEGPAEETCSARVSVRYCKSNESESRALFSLKYHRAFERFFAVLACWRVGVLACWRDNSPSQAKVNKANQKIKEANVRTTEVSKKIHITKWNIHQLSDWKINTR